MAFEMMSDRPPLAAWPQRVEAHEPAHGLFRRIARANNQVSTLTLGPLVGVNARNPDPQELMEFCQQFPIEGLELLAPATPRVIGQIITIYGQSFRKLDWSLRNPRVCPICIRESPHHRTWFDINVLSSCPYHGHSIIGEEEGKKLASWSPQIGMTVAGKLISPVTPISPPHGKSWERYVLGRMSLIEGFPLDTLDDCQLFEIIDAAILLGAAGRRLRDKGSYCTSHRVRREAVLEGFRALSAGVAGITTHLEAAFLLNTGPAPALKRTASSRHTFALNVAEFSNPALRRLIGDAWYDARLRYGLHRRSKTIPRQPDDPLPLYLVSQRLNLPLSSTRKLALKLGFIQPDVDSSRSHAVSPVQLEEMGRILADLVTRNEACKHFGVSIRVFGRLKVRAAIKPFVTFDHQLYRRYDLEAAFAAHLGAKVGASARRIPKKRALRPDVMTASVAASALGVPRAAIPALIKADLLSAAQGESAVALISSDSVEAFRKRYAPSQIYTSHLGCRPSTVPSHLRRLGLQGVAVPNLRKPVIYVRADVRAALNLDFDPDDARVLGEGRFWRSVNEALVNRRSANQIVSIQDGRATVVSGDRRTLVWLTINKQPYSAKLEMECSATRSPRRFRAVSERLKYLEEALPQADVGGSVQEGRVTLSESLPLDSIKEAELQNRLVLWLESRMDILRAFFVQRD